MVLYECSLCNYNTNHKGTFDRHLQSKKHCNFANVRLGIVKRTKKPKGINSSITTGINTGIMNVSKNSKNNQNKAVIQQSNSVRNSVKQNINEQIYHFSKGKKNDMAGKNGRDCKDCNMIYDCEFCGKVFTKKNNLYRHRKHYCNANESLNYSDNNVISNKDSISIINEDSDINEDSVINEDIIDKYIIDENITNKKTNTSNKNKYNKNKSSNKNTTEINNDSSQVGVNVDVNVNIDGLDNVNDKQNDKRNNKRSDKRSYEQNQYENINVENRTGQDIIKASRKSRRKNEDGTKTREGSSENMSIIKDGEKTVVEIKDTKDLLGLLDKNTIVEYIKKEFKLDLTNNNNLNFVNSNNCNNTNYNTINQININPLGKEDISFITEDIKMSILENIYMAVPELIKTVHNQDCNRNFFIKNMNKQIMGYIDSDNKIKFDDYKNVLEKIVDNNIDRVNDFYIDLHDQIKETCQMKIQKMIESSNCGDLNDKYIENIKYYVLDNTNRNRQMIKDVIEHS
jgi:hypothetical protein